MSCIKGFTPVTLLWTYFHKWKLAGGAELHQLFATVKVWLMHLPTQRQQTVARLSFEESAAHFYLRNDWQKTNFRLCQRGELWSTRWDAKCQRHKPSRGEKMWPVCNRGIKQDEKDPNNPGAGGGFTFSSTLLSPLRWGVAAPVFGWHVSIICAFQTHVLCAGDVLHMHMTRVSGSCLTTSSGCGSWVSPMSWMLRTGNSAARGMMTFTGPQWNTTECPPMTCRPLTLHLSFTLLLSSFTTLCPQAVIPHTGPSRLDIETKHLCIHFLSFMVFRKGVRALCCRCKSLSCVGPGLPDDLSASQSPVLRALRTTETLDFSQQRLFETTYNTGSKTPRVKRVKSNYC